MMRSWWFALAVVAAALGQRGWAKPPDLPAESPIECAAVDDEPAKTRLSIEFGIGPKGVTLKFGVGVVPPEPTPTIDAVCPSIVSAYVQSLLERMKTQPTDAASSASDRDKQARQLFEVAEFYRRTSHYASAKFYYQRSHQAAPTSRLGRLAIDRIGEMEDRLRAADESSERDPEALFQEMRERTVPLGLTQQATY
jgi:hypothetical protein